MSTVYDADLSYDADILYDGDSPVIPQTEVILEDPSPTVLHG
jgi:hypothetical protein